MQNDPIKLFLKKTIYKNQKAYRIVNVSIPDIQTCKFSNDYKSVPYLNTDKPHHEPQLFTNKSKSGITLTINTIITENDWPDFVENFKIAKEKFNNEYETYKQLEDNWLDDEYIQL